MLGTIESVTKTSLDSTHSLFLGDAPTVARKLVGALLVNDGVGGVIVETEAYDATDPASHSYGGPRARNRVMFGPPGHIYVYRSHGLHWCLNVVCGAGGAAVLVRALEPTIGIEEMCRRRGTNDVFKLCAGPGRLCQALGVTGEVNGSPVGAPIELHLPYRPPPIGVSARIGISRGAETPWRFFDSASRFVSRATGAK